jgi:two-component system cell cycle sensor histidine kinase/response regulator CckA
MRSGTLQTFLGSLVMAACGLGAQPATGSAVLPLLTNIQQVIALPDKEAKRSYPVRLQGVVTYCDQEWNLLFIHDGTASTFVKPSSIQTPVRAGTLVDLHGVSGWEAGGSMVADARLSIVGPGEMPTARRISAGDFLAGKGGNSWVELEGIVRLASDPTKRLQLELVANGRRIKALVMNYAPTNLATLVDATVRLRGVAASTYSRQGRITGAQLFVPSTNEIRIIRPPVGDPSTLTPLRISSLGRLASRGPEIHRVPVVGAVIRNRMGESLTIRDQSGTVRLLTSQMTAVQIGDQVKGLGFPGWRASELVLEDSVFSVMKSAAGMATNSEESQILASNSATNHPSILRRARQILSLSSEVATQRVPVRIEGVVTYCDLDWGVLFVQDATAGIFVDLSGKKPDVQNRQFVKIEGVTGPGHYAPVVVASTVQGLEQGELPRAKVVTMERLVTGVEDSQWVEIQGAIRSVTNQWGHVTLEVATQAGRFQANIPGYGNRPPPLSLVDAVVSIRGVCGTRFNPNRQLVGIQLFVPSESEIKVLEASPADPFASPVRRIAELMRFAPEELAGHRDHVQGTLVLQKPGRYLYLQDETGGIYVESNQTNHLAVGQRLDVLGYPSVEDYKLSLREAIFRPRDIVTSVEPAAVTAQQILEGQYDAQLVTLEGTILNCIPGTFQHTYVVQANDQMIFSASLEVSPGQKMTTFPKGSLIQLTGVCSVELSGWDQIRSFRLWLSSDQDVRLLRRPAWWTPRRALRTVGVLVCLVAAVLTWVLALQRRVQRQTQHIRQQLDRETALQERYRDLYENASDIILTSDLQGNCTSLNNAAERFFGYPAKEIMELGVGKLVASEQLPLLEQALQRLQAGIPQPPLVLECLCQGGQRRFLEVNGRMLIQDGKSVGVQCIGRDISERRRAEEALRQSEMKYKELANLLPQTVFETDIEGRLVFANQMAFAMSGYSASEFDRGLRIQDMVAFEDKEKLDERMAQVLAGRQFGGTEWSIIRKDGTTFPALIYSTTVMRDQKPVGVRGILIDISERKRVEDQLLQLSRAVEQSPVSIVITDLTGKIIYVNPQVLRVTGFPLEEIIGQNSRIWQSGETPRSIYKKMWETITAGQEWRGEWRNRRKNGALFWESACVSPIKNAKGVITHFLAVKEDITEHRNLETQLRQLQKMEAVGQLAAGVAHDFNNLLTVIQGHVSLLLSENRLPAEFRDPLEEVSTAGQRAADLTRQLLAFSRKQLLRLKILNLNEVCTNTAKMLKRLLGEHIGLEFDYSSEPPLVRADAGMLEQIIMNLAVNARDAMPKGGRLRISTALVDVEAAYTKKNPEASIGRFARLSVVDTGCGMDEKVRSRIFEPFFTTKEVGKGTGLGLATVYGIVKQHQGWIEVQSTVGSGTAFNVFFPLLAQSQAAPVLPPELMIPRGGNEGVMVVEDEPALRLLVRTVLRRSGYHVLEAANGTEALRMWNQHQDQVSLLLTDMVMPEGMTGRDLADQLHRDKPRLKVIFTSGYSVDLAGKEFVPSQGCHFLPKPYQPEVLLKAVRDCLDNHV